MVIMYLFIMFRAQISVTRLFVIGFDDEREDEREEYELSCAEHTYVSPIHEGPHTAEALPEKRGACCSPANTTHKQQFITATETIWRKSL